MQNPTPATIQSAVTTPLELAKQKQEASLQKQKELEERLQAVNSELQQGNPHKRRKKFGKKHKTAAENGPKQSQAKTSAKDTARQSCANFINIFLDTICLFTNFDLISSYVVRQ